ncbi:hypothetical protein BCR34DRAFT_374792 [Clohesyomyces aquaticus]|uniref:Uncharacterized protein n=1 Tax=Clohesyomyces aquaticus TaxID=1231657 RepID=A0A1Y1ZGH8_9PLEO|nr:hypothetical protein BCR34DRAFT_374792 [Clohesyomyces aquaticus]
MAVLVLNGKALGRCIWTGHIVCWTVCWTVCRASTISTKGFIEAMFQVRVIPQGNCPDILGSRSARIATFFMMLPRWELLAFLPRLCQARRHASSLYY